MDILQDIVVGSVGGLAIRGLKRLILGRRTDTTTQQIGDLRARIQQQQIIIDSLQDNLQVVLGSKRSAEEFEEDNAHVPKRQKLELTNSPHQEIQREIVSHPLISLTQTNSEISHDSEPSNLLQIEAPNPVNRKEETSKSESESDESDSSESESSESDSSDSESSESSSESDESSGDSLTSEESSSSEESEFSSEKSDSSEESSDESSEGSESEESSEDIGQLPSRKYSSVSKNSEEESSDQELKGKSNEDRIASLSGLEYPELANEDLWEAPQNRRIVSIRRVPRLDSNLGSNVLGLSEPPYGRSRSVSENRSGPIRVRDYTHSIPRMTGYVSRDSYQRSRSRSMSRSLSRSRSQSLRSESRSRSVSRSYSRSVSRSRSPRPMSNLEDSQKSASQTPSKLSLKSHENEVQEEKNQTSEGHWTIGTSNQGGHKSYAFPNYEDPEEFTPHISAPSLPSQSRENSPSVSLRSKSKSENSTLLPENSEISQPREISREISPLFPSPNPPIPDIPSENLESESSPAPPEFSEGSSIPKSSRSKSYAEERELLRQEEIQWQEAEHEVSRLCEREKSLSDQTGSVLERGRKVLELPWPKSLRNSQNSAGVIEQGEFSSPRITPAYCNLIPSYTPEYSEFGLNPVTYSPYTSPACGTPYRPCYVTKPYHPYDTELGLYETCRYSGHGGAYEGGMQRTNNYGRGLNWLTHIPSPPKLSPYQAPEINLTEEEEEEDDEEEEEVEEEGGEEEDEEEKEEEEEMEEEQNEGSEIRQKSPSATPSGLDIPYNQEKSESYQPQNEANSGESPRSGLENQQTNFEAETDLQAGNEDEEYSEKAESELQDSPEPQLDDPQPKFQVSPQSAVIEEEDRVYDIGEFNLAPEEENQAEYEPRLCTAKHRFESQTTMTPTGISRQNGLEQFGLEDDLNEDEGESKRQNEPDLSQNKEKEFGQTEKWDEEEFVPSEQEKEDPIYTENEDEGPELESSDSDSMSLGGESYKEEFDENFFYEEGMSSESEDCSIAQSGWETSLNHSVSYDDSYLEKYEQYKEVSSKDQKDQSKPSWDEVFPQIEDDLEPEILETNPAVQEPRSSDFQIPTQKFRFFAPQPHNVLDDGFPAHNVQKSFAGSIVPNVLDEARILDQFNVLDNETPEQNEFDASQEEKNNFARGRLPDWSQSPEQSLEDEDKANNGEEIESQPSPDRNNPFSELARQEDESAGGREETFGGPPKALSWLERGLERGVRGLGARLERLGRYLGDRQEGASNLDAQYDKHEVCRPLHHQRHTLGVTHWDPSNRHDKFYRRGRKFGHKHSKYHHKFSGNDHRQGNRRQRTHTGHQSWDDFQMFPSVEATSGDIVDASSEPNLEDDGFQILSVRNSPFPIRPQNFPSSIVHPVIDLTDDSS